MPDQPRNCGIFLQDLGIDLTEKALLRLQSMTLESSESR